MKTWIKNWTSPNLVMVIGSACLLTNGVSECKMDVKSIWIPNWDQMFKFYNHLDYFQNPPIGGRPNTKVVDHGTLKSYNHCFIVFFYHV